MSRPLRIEYTGAWYHIMNRGRKGDNVFDGKEDCEIFVALLKEAAELWNVRIRKIKGVRVKLNLTVVSTLDDMNRYTYW